MRSGPTVSRPVGEEGARDETGEVVATIVAPPAEEHSASKLDPAVLHGPVGDAVRLIEPYSEADPIAILTTLLAGIGNLVGGGPHLLVGRTRHPARLYVLQIGATAVSRKGTALADGAFIFEFLDLGLGPRADQARPGERRRTDLPRPGQARW